MSLGLGFVTEDGRDALAPPESADLTDETVQRTPAPTEVLIDRLGLLGEEILAELRHVRSALGSASRSSVEIKTSTRGVDVTCKAYEGSDISEAGDAAMAEYARVMAEINQRLADAINGGS